MLGERGVESGDERTERGVGGGNVLYVRMFAVEVCSQRLHDDRRTCRTFFSLFLLLLLLQERSRALFQDIASFQV